MSAVPNPPVSVRFSTAERDTLEAAAAQARTTLSDFLRRRALEAAEAELLAHPLVVIPAADWDRFEEWAHRPAESVPALRELAAIRPAWLD